MPTNFELAFSERPDVLAAWQQLNGAIKSNMDLRRYELATVAAAQRLRSTYCSVAHGRILVDQLDEPLHTILTDPDAELSELDRAIMDFAVQVVDDATAIEEADRDRLRALGLSDAEIMEVVLAATARCFFAKTLDALDVRADASYATMQPELLELLVVGRPLADA
jgi:alkylhydroperoxidase family enzyme